MVVRFAAEKYSASRKLFLQHGINRIRHFDVRVEQAYKTLERLSSFRSKISVKYVRQVQMAAGRLGNIQDQLPAGFSCVFHLGLDYHGLILADCRVLPDRSTGLRMKGNLRSRYSLPWRSRETTLLRGRRKLHLPDPDILSTIRRFFASGGTRSRGRTPRSIGRPAVYSSNFRCLGVK